jgi:YidC/Oxa1 family membrane protein insertase
LADFQNPQQEPGAEKRLLLVFLLTFVVLIIFQPLLKKYMPQAPAAPQQKQSAPQPTAATAPRLGRLRSGGRSVGAIGEGPGLIANKQASSEAETVIENDLYKITFTNRGAQVKSWILKKFDNDAQNGPLDLVNAAAAQKYGYPLSLWTYDDETLRNKLNSALYVASNEGQLSAPAQITFEYADQDVVVRKTFRFDHTYVLNVETSVVYKGAEIFAAPAWPAGFGDEVTPASYAAARIDYHNDVSTDRTGWSSRISFCVWRARALAAATRSKGLSSGLGPAINTSPPFLSPTIRTPRPWSRCATPGVRRSPAKSRLQRHCQR